MAVIYFDSSAFVKLLVEEAGSALAVQLWDGADMAVSNRLAFVEVRAALAAAERAQRLIHDLYVTACEQWQSYWEATRIVDLSESLSVCAARLAGEHALRGADAIHLASATALGSESVTFACWDRRLRKGALSAGLSLVPPA